MRINLENIIISQNPFTHFHAPSIISDRLAEETLRWFENDAPWKLTVTDFYEQYEISILNTNLPHTLSKLYDNHYLKLLRSNIENLFQTSLSNFIEVTAHKLVAGQKICIHNDFIPGKETHRFVIHLNRNWQKDWGGLFLLFNNSNPESLSRIIMPVNNSALGFAISPDSHHAVSTVYQGERFTLVYSFYAD